MFVNHKIALSKLSHYIQHALLCFVLLPFIKIVALENKRVANHFAHSSKYGSIFIVGVKLSSFEGLLILACVQTISKNFTPPSLDLECGSFLIDFHIELLYLLAKDLVDFLGESLRLNVTDPHLLQISLPLSCLSFTKHFLFLFLKYVPLLN